MSIRRHTWNVVGGEFEGAENVLRNDWMKSSVVLMVIIERAQSVHSILDLVFAFLFNLYPISPSLSNIVISNTLSYNRICTEWLLWTIIIFSVYYFLPVHTRHTNRIALRPQRMGGEALYTKYCETKQIQWSYLFFLFSRFEYFSYHDHH